MVGIAQIPSNLDKVFQRNYDKEQRTASMVIRTKEIGIRKVLGASATRVALLLSKDCISLVLVAIIIASPVAWYCMNIWLQNFAYQIHIVGGCL
ncbi:ABC transporter permease [Niastella sp. OAS944]|uniref:ABC transporter permease n=1 Tax=Niastella sp. OAS944 TaxID=2664089 RepID=UPI0035C80882|nr:ABC-type antimicrobial peptide transport system permease subunit [Chitinophagaceae bacterium OAS944]